MKKITLLGLLVISLFGEEVDYLKYKNGEQIPEEQKAMLLKQVKYDVGNMNTGANMTQKDKDSFLKENKIDVSAFKDLVKQKQNQKYME